MSVIELVAPGARALLDPRRGGRLCALRVDGVELLDQSTAPPGQPIGFYGGSFPMVPFAGFIPEQRLREIGATMASNVPGGASHGLVYDGVWHIESCTDVGATMSFRIDEGWMAGGEVRQRFELDDDALRMHLSFDAVKPVPAALGFHPWFRRDLGTGPAEVLIDADAVLSFDETGLVAERLGEPPTHPWDHFVVGVRNSPVIRWPGLDLSLEANTSSWIVYEQPLDAVCIEPVTAPISEVVAGNARTRAGEVLSLEFTMRWTRRATAEHTRVPETP